MYYPLVSNRQINRLYGPLGRTLRLMCDIGCFIGGIIIPVPPVVYESDAFRKSSEIRIIKKVIPKNRCVPLSFVTTGNMVRTTGIVLCNFI